MDQNDQHDDEQRDPLDQPTVYQHHLGSDPLELLIAAEAARRSPVEPSIMPDLDTDGDRLLAAADRVLEGEAVRVAQGEMTDYIEDALDVLRCEFGIRIVADGTEDKLNIASAVHEGLVLAFTTTTLTPEEAAESVAYVLDLPVHPRWAGLGCVKAPWQ